MGNLFCSLGYISLQMSFSSVLGIYVPLLPPPLHPPLQACLPSLFLLFAIKKGVSVFLLNQCEWIFLDLFSSYLGLVCLPLLSHSLRTGCCFLPTFLEMTDFQSVVLGLSASINEGNSWFPCLNLTQELWRQGSAICVFISFPGDCGAS